MEKMKSFCDSFTLYLDLGDCQHAFLGKQCSGICSSDVCYVQVWTAIWKVWAMFAPVIWNWKNVDSCLCLMSLSVHNPHTAFARSLERPTASVAVPSGFLCCLLMLKHLEIYKNSRSRSYLQDCICFCSDVKVLSDMLQTCMQSFWLTSSACINSYSYISFWLFCMNTLLFLLIGDCRIITQRKHLVYFFMPELRYSLNNTTWLLLVIKVVLKVTVSFSSPSPSIFPAT